MADRGRLLTEQPNPHSGELDASPLDREEAQRRLETCDGFVRRALRRPE